ncbi:hypothetical protein VNO78_22505 [Psophocarpus tetragonolobus]|uniref:Uncharacterized protein n=1 Tax=Psophocarpus tetragonolobus TaxID=3891 RepID=A0AAN9S1Q8_PSOTE
MCQNDSFTNSGKALLACKRGKDGCVHVKQLSRWVHQFKAVEGEVFFLPQIRIETQRDAGNVHEDENCNEKGKRRSSFHEKMNQLLFDEVLKAYNIPIQALDFVLQRDSKRGIGSLKKLKGVESD